LSLDKKTPVGNEPTRAWSWPQIVLAVVVGFLALGSIVLRQGGPGPVPMGERMAEDGADRLLGAIREAQEAYRLDDYYALCRRFLSRFPEHPAASAVRAELALQLVADNLQTPTSTGAAEARALLAESERSGPTEAERFDAALLLLKFSTETDPGAVAAEADRVRAKYGKVVGVSEVDDWLIARLLELDDVKGAAARAEATIDRAPKAVQEDYRRLIARAKLIGAPFTLDAAERKQIGKPLEGQVVIVDFWASWCRPCLEAQPALEAFQRAHPGLLIIGVNLDEDPAEMKAHPTPFPQLRGSGLEDRFGITQLPTYLLLDRESKIVATELEGDALFARAEALLKGSSSPDR
jgi:thiol-disulfide isomerase/thioredoxin